MSRKTGFRKIRIVIRRLLLIFSDLFDHMLHHGTAIRSVGRVIQLHRALFHLRKSDVTEFSAFGMRIAYNRGHETKTLIREIFLKNAIALTVISTTCPDNGYTYVYQEVYRGSIRGFGNQSRNAKNGVALYHLPLARSALFWMTERYISRKTAQTTSHEFIHA